MSGMPSSQPSSQIFEVSMKLVHIQALQVPPATWLNSSSDRWACPGGRPES